MNHKPITWSDLKIWLPIAITLAAIFIQVGIANQKLDTLVEQYKTFETTISTMDMRLTDNTIKIGVLESKVNK